jgi:mannose-6-phosphate isomerase-like protein (cupin superfamily)
MKIIRSKDFTEPCLGGAGHRQHERHHHPPALDRSAVRWHINDGEEVFVVLDGRVQMRYRDGGMEQVAELEVGDIFYAGVGTEHVAHPQGPARILVIESEGSV